ncbi:helix-turn-helix domain-containing protein [Escherichia coli]|uniref:helix-turn-helix domain-containing protein n=1 Tax=Escherichia coli TaxID=562 RepID=UPI001C29185D|nr:helix-turn-helix domain-containing protein [Escherichia coli]
MKKLTIDAIINYIEENLELRNVSIDDLINYSGYSRRYLQMLFKECFNIPVGKYIQYRRITRAALFLKLTGMSITEISERLCYDSQQTFTREFKKNTGYTPLQFRKSNSWIFKNQTGKKEINTPFPIPFLCHIKRTEFYGIPVTFSEDIPYAEHRAKTNKKWTFIREHFLQSEKTLFISNSIIPRKEDNNRVYIDYIIWSTKKSFPKHNHLIHDGIYAFFRYTGTISEYISYIKNIYLNVLPYYGLQKNNSYDLEIIYKHKNDVFVFEYFIPICNENIHMQ